MDINSAETPPRDQRALACWLAEGVRAEIASLESQTKSLTYEVLSGTQVERRGEYEAVFRFLLADTTQLPDEASGRLKVPGAEYSATIQQVQGDALSVLVVGPPSVPTSIPRATLVIDDTALLRKLAQKLDEIASTSPDVGTMAVEVFHPRRERAPSCILPNWPWMTEVDQSGRTAIERSCSDAVTYVFGPPGTGKTYVIARIIASLIELGERVLLTSHTHAAVDQAVYELFNPEPRKHGPLVDHPGLKAAKFLRIGKTEDRNVPDSVRLECVVTDRASDITKEIDSLNHQIGPLRQSIAKVRAGLSEWDRLDATTTRLNETRALRNAHEKTVTTSTDDVAANCSRLAERQAALDKARNAWLFRDSRVDRALRAIADAKEALRVAEAVRAQITNELRGFEREERLLLDQKTLVESRCQELPGQADLQRDLDRISASLDPLEARHRELQAALESIPRDLISNADVLFCTLTKNYTSDLLKDQTVDAVIIDEISMALPPLVFLAANRSRRRVILVGDFWQLPPVVRGDSEISDARLRKDMFRLSGIVGEDGIPTNAETFVGLDTQRRMHPSIADTARKLVYNLFFTLHDHTDVMSRPEPSWLGHLPTNPLIIADTVDLNCWCGKQPGSLSRFNLYSARVSVQIAARAARNLPVPPDSTRRQIGIIAPYAAQRRLIQKLVDEVGLRPWVTVGTVHTFQGHEAELIIFDSVLDEPYWTARLCTPGSARDVLRDLNVAVTRAKSKLIFIGSSEWLNKYARVPSGLGRLWEHLKAQGDLLPASELTGDGGPENSQAAVGGGPTWSMPQDDGIQRMELLDETSFFNRFEEDLRQVKDSVFAFAAYFGEYRWPLVEPLFRDALGKGVKVTIITPPAKEAPNEAYVAKVIRNLRANGARVVAAMGMHGKDIILDERIIYTGSMNWASSRGRAEIVHRIDSREYAAFCLEMVQARHIREAATDAKGEVRLCPHCGSETQIVNLRRQPRWEFNPLKIGCSNTDCSRGYLVPIDSRPPFVDPPICEVDHLTRYRRARRGRGEVWRCPKHPKQCTSYKVIPGDCRVGESP